MNNASNIVKHVLVCALSLSILSFSIVLNYNNDNTINEQREVIKQLSKEHQILLNEQRSAKLLYDTKHYMLMKHDMNNVVSNVSTKLKKLGWSSKKSIDSAFVCASNLNNE